MERFWNIKTAALALILATAAAFYPCINADFTNWDDDAYVTSNALISNLSPENIAKIFSSFQQRAYSPLPVLSFAVEYKFAGLNPKVYHADNLALHIINALLALLLLYRLGKNLNIAFFASLFFALHPLRVESVAWISQRKDLLYACFLLLAFLRYLDYRETGKKAQLWLCAGLFTLSLFCKTMGITFPFMLLLADFFAGRKPERGVLTEKIPFFAVSLLFTVITAYGQASASGYSPLAGHPLINRLALAGNAFSFYLWKTFWPFNLCAVYPYPEHFWGGVPASYLPGALAAAFIIAQALLLAKQQKAAAFGVLFFLASTAPVLGLVPLDHVMAADRFTYFAHIGFMFAVMVYAERLAPRVRVPLFTALAIILLAAANARCRAWADSVTLWTDAIEKQPRAVLAYTNRATAYLENNAPDKAQSDLETALRLDPNNAAAYANMGAVFHARGKLGEAVSYYNKAISLERNMFPAYANRAKIYEETKQYEKAAEDYTSILAFRRNAAPIYYARAMDYLRLGKNQEALADLDKTIELRSDFAQAYLFRSGVYYFMREYEKVIDDCAMVLKLGYSPEQALNNRAKAYMELGRTDDAFKDYSEAIKINPGYYTGYVNRAEIFMLAGKTREALADLTKAIEINPKFDMAHYLRGYVRAKSGDCRAAAADFKAAIKLNPENNAAKAELARCRGQK